MKRRSTLLIGLIVIIFFVCQTTALVIPTDGLLAYYSFDGSTNSTVEDESGNGYDGTINGATVTEGISGSALNFDGNDVVTLPFLFSDNMEARQVTLVAFVNLSDIIVSETFVNTGDPEIGMGLSSDGHIGSGVKMSDNNWHVVTGTSDVPLNAWIMVTTTLNKDTATYQVYLDGVLDITSTIPDINYWHVGLIPSIGAHMYAGGENYLNGDIDEVMIYDRALTADEIKNIYNIYTNQPLVNQAPAANNDYYTMNQDTVLIVPSEGVLMNDNDPESDSLTSSCVATPINGGLLLDPDGSFIYTPLPDWYGNVTFTYKANDGIADSNEAQVWITVNKAPIPSQYVINTTIVGSGSISPSGDTIVLSGVDQSFDLQSKKPYQIAVITIDGITIDLKNLVVTFNNVLSDHTISAEFTSPSNKPTK